jgi:transposase
MAKSRYQKHSEEFRAEAVRLVKETQAPLAQIARELGVKDSTLRLWVQDARCDPPISLREDERTELQRLRKEVRTLRTDREILKKAAAFFAKHQG